MDVDISSPPMRFRTSSNKRTRSPGSPSPAERMSKRAMIISEESDALQAWPPGHVVKRRPVHEEEWLDQTRDLTIHSPALSSNAGELEHAENEMDYLQRHTSHEDVHMNSQEADGGSQPTLRPQDSNITREASPFVSMPAPDAEVIMTSSTSTPRRQTTSRHQQLSAGLHITLPSQVNGQANNYPHPEPSSAPPHITLHPATPATPSDGVRASHLTLLSSSPMSMAVESTPSAPVSPSGWRHGSQRKRSAVTMGPRADCEKCRSKVPGHWMHFD